MFIKDSAGEKSITATAFLIGFIVVNVKLVMSGIQVTAGFTFSDFTGSDYAVSLGALGAIYVMRRAYPGNSTHPNNGIKDS